jgi:hypothetical protein
VHKFIVQNENPRNGEQGEIYGNLLMEERCCYQGRTKDAAYTHNTINNMDKE